MGCTPSNINTQKNKLTKERLNNNNNNNNCSVVLDSTLRQLLRVYPPVKIDIGSGVNSIQEFKHTVIFIFGGPGSLKGILTQELAQEFEFITISVEDIVFSYLPNKVANSVESIVEIQEFIRRDPKIINLGWILQKLSVKIATSNNQRFIIDIMPELTSLLRSDAFSGNEHEVQLLEFDRKHPVQFALELRIAEERQLLEGHAQSKISKVTSELSKVKMSAELSAFMKGVDEADKGRLERRLDSFHQYSEPFLEYFRKTKRVVRLDLKIPNNEEILPTIRRMFVDFGFGRNNDSIRVVLFATSEHQIEDIDLSYYNFRKVQLLDICHDTEETLSQQIRSIRKFIYRTAQPNENIIVILKGFNDTDYPLSKRINFLEYQTTYLDFYIRNRERRSPRSRCKMAFRAITSTIGEVCLFPEAIPSKLCKKIGFIFSEKLSLSETDTRVPSQMSILPGSPFLSPPPPKNYNYDNISQELFEFPQEQSNVVSLRPPSLNLTPC